MSDRVSITVTQIPDNVQVQPDHTNEIVRVVVSSEGATGPAGPPGPNTITTATTTDIIGLFIGVGGFIQKVANIDSISFDSDGVLTITNASGTFTSAFNFIPAP